MDIEDANGATDTTEESKKEKPTITSVGLKENIKNVAAAAKSSDSETPLGEENTSTTAGNTEEETKAATPDDKESEDKEDGDGEVQVEDAQQQEK